MYKLLNNYFVSLELLTYHFIFGVLKFSLPLYLKLYTMAAATVSPNNTPYLVNPCTFYFTQVDQIGAPILGTMFSKHTNILSDGQTVCTEVRLPSTQMIAPAGHRQCFFPNGNRYFYLVNQQTGQVVSNSMTLRTNQSKPDQMCVGTNHYLEYKNFVGTPTNAIVA